MPLRGIVLGVHDHVQVEGRIDTRELNKNAVCSGFPSLINKSESRPTAAIWASN
jgi:hypothetical protein